MPEASSEVRLYGHALTDLDPPALARGLARAGLPPMLRESSLRGGGTYLRIHGAADAECTLERIAPAEYQAAGDAVDADAFHALVRALSAALAGMDVRHRLEVYDGDDVLVAYFHHLWPPPS